MNTEFLVKLNMLFTVILFAWVLGIVALVIELPVHAKTQKPAPSTESVYGFTLAAMGKTAVIAECAGAKRYQLCCETAAQTMLCAGNGAQLTAHLVKSESGYYAVINGADELINAQCRLYCQK